MLFGARGLVLWDSAGTIVQSDATLGARGGAYASLFAQIHRIAPQLIDSEPVTDPVATLYSPASFRVL